MGEEMVQRILLQNTKEDILEVLMEKEELSEDLSLWDERVIKHVMKVYNITFEELQDLVKPIEKLI